MGSKRQPRRNGRVATVGIVVAAVAVLWLVVPTTGAGQASAITCGTTITTDTTLDVDLVDCPDHGIVIGADDITLDLNGHVIDGDGFADCPKKEFCDSACWTTATTG